MALDLVKFYQATDPTKTLAVENEEDRKYYIDFSKVRGGNLIEELKNTITFFSPEKPTCQLFTGYIGCGKSTEFLRLKAELEQEGFHVVYFESSEDLEMGDVDIGDILLAIARQVSQSLESLKTIEIPEPKGFKNLLKGIAKLLYREIEISAEASIPGIGKVSASNEEEFSIETTIPGLGELTVNREGLSLVAEGIGKITAKAKNSPELRGKLREYLGPRTTSILEVINQELLEPAKEKLKQQGKKGLVVIVDNLDRVENIKKPWGQMQPEYLFVDRSEQLRQLNCHVVYTMPLALMFSNNLARLAARFGINPNVLPMVPVQLRDGGDYAEGMELMRQIVLARAFPDVESQQRLDLIEEVFDSAETLDRLCRVSGGHIRNLLILINEWIQKERKLPLSREGLEKVIKARCNQMKLAIKDREWELLRQVQRQKEVRGEEEYQVLIRSMFVYECRDNEGSFFYVNPILLEAGKL
ncbi:MAG: ATP-binding protein [Xenococcaceae cyanobacterium]